MAGYSGGSGSSEAYYGGDGDGVHPRHAFYSAEQQQQQQQHQLPQAPPSISQYLRHPTHVQSNAIVGGGTAAAGAGLSAADASPAASISYSAGTGAHTALGVGLGGHLDSCTSTDMIMMTSTPQEHAGRGPLSHHQLLKRWSGGLPSTLSSISGISGGGGDDTGTGIGIAGGMLRTPGASSLSTAPLSSTFAYHQQQHGDTYLHSSSNGVPQQLSSTLSTASSSLLLHQPVSLLSPEPTAANASTSAGRIPAAAPAGVSHYTTTPSSSSPSSSFHPQSIISPEGTGSLQGVGRPGHLSLASLERLVPGLNSIRKGRPAAHVRKSSTVATSAPGSSASYPQPATGSIGSKRSRQADLQSTAGGGDGGGIFVTNEPAAGMTATGFAPAVPSSSMTASAAVDGAAGFRPPKHRKQSVALAAESVSPRLHPAAHLPANYHPQQQQQPQRYALAAPSSHPAHFAAAAPNMCAVCGVEAAVDDDFDDLQHCDYCTRGFHPFCLDEEDQTSLALAHAGDGGSSREHGGDQNQRLPWACPVCTGKLAVPNIEFKGKIDFGTAGYQQGPLWHPQPQPHPDKLHPSSSVTAAFTNSAPARPVTTATASRASAAPTASGMAGHPTTHPSSSTTGSTGTSTTVTASRKIKPGNVDSAHRGLQPQQLPRKPAAKAPATQPHISHQPHHHVQKQHQPSQPSQPPERDLSTLRYNLGDPRYRGPTPDGGFPSTSAPASAASSSARDHDGSAGGRSGSISGGNGPIGGGGGGSGERRGAGVHHRTLLIPELGGGDSGDGGDGGSGGIINGYGGDDAAAADDAVLQMLSLATPQGANFGSFAGLHRGGIGSGSGSNSNGTGSFNGSAGGGVGAAGMLHLTSSPSSSLLASPAGLLPLLPSSTSSSAAAAAISGLPPLPPPPQMRTGRTRRAAAAAAAAEAAAEAMLLEPEPAGVVVYGTAGSSGSGNAAGAGAASDTVHAHAYERQQFNSGPASLSHGSRPLDHHPQPRAHERTFASRDAHAYQDSEPSAVGMAQHQHYGGGGDDDAMMTTSVAAPAAHAAVSAAAVRVPVPVITSPAVQRRAALSSSASAQASQASSSAAAGPSALRIGDVFAALAGQGDDTTGGGGGSGGGGEVSAGELAGGTGGDGCSAAPPAAADVDPLTAGMPSQVAVYASILGFLARPDISQLLSDTQRRKVS